MLHRTLLWSSSCPPPAPASLLAVSMQAEGRSGAEVGRRQLLGGAAAAAGLAVLGGKAEVVGAKEKSQEEGGLPPGLKEYFDLMKSKKAWADIGKRVSEGHGEMDDAEWTNIQGYLRGFYGKGDDMNKLAQRFTSKEREAVAENTKLFKKAVRAIDKPAAAKDWEEFTKQHAEINGYLLRWFDIRAGKLEESPANSVPDEI
uniref:Uncharacterized protein n=1 Tax=Hemiselmis tepida TaxID=464990 RepID=A0A7S0VM21_9CRYP|mmetsp:Transcript_19545/g.49555  ORF Transcript_19545/g.49555 Transcript_19545/m.49555 type:complete len:201 (+) Transcript_19545:1-603(+)